MPSRRLTLAALLSVAGVAVLSAGCTPSAPAFNGVDITGASYARDFALTDAAGKRRTLAEFRGKLVVVFFGFAQCPDVCPTTLADLAQVKKRLGSDGERIQVVFITVDPERDSPQVLASYVPAFDPSFIGLTGTSEEIAAAAREFKVFYQKVAGKTETSYTIDHTAGAYVFDREGRVRLFIRHATGAEAIAADLQRLLR
ncbi:MAG: SCO family protein [Betaproteobacteria bacterium]|jgi:protein SCO1/2